MMSRHGANLIFFNKKIRIGRLEHLQPPPTHTQTHTHTHTHAHTHTLRPITYHFRLTHSSNSQSGSHMCITSHRKLGGLEQGWVGEISLTTKKSGSFLVKHL